MSNIPWEEAHMIASLLECSDAISEYDDQGHCHVTVFCNKRKELFYIVGDLEFGIQYKGWHYGG